MTNFNQLESQCQFTFSQLGYCWHLYTPENNEIIFTSETDFKAGVSLFAIAALLSPKVKILTFELMSNHLHATISGDKEDVIAFFNLLVSLLIKHFKSEGRHISANSLELNLRAITSLDDARAVIVYNNRNGFLVCPNHTPFSYPYGANAFYFNPLAKQLFHECKTKIRSRELENLAHSHSVRSIQGEIYVLDGQICPLCFCDVSAGEALFRNANQYFYFISKNIESQKRIAEEIGDRIFYTDDELFSIACSISKKQYNIFPSQLPKDAKIDMAKILHFEYNAGNKQIARMLKIEVSIVNSLFPSTR